MSAGYNQRTWRNQSHQIQGGTCTRCGVLASRLHRHHVTPRRTGGQDTGSNIHPPLCPSCHQNHGHASSYLGWNARD